MTNRDDPDVAVCLAAFAARDYLTCYVLAGNHARQHLDELVFHQLVLICLQRLGQTEEFGELSGLLLDTTSDPWETSLLQLTNGQAALESVRRDATDAERLCQATCYAGARLLSIGRPDDAETILRESVGQAAECLEHRLAEIELSAMSAADTPDRADQVFEFLDRRANSVLREGHYDQAVRAAEEACDLARRTWGQHDGRFVGGLSTLLTSLAYAGRTTDALELAPLAVELAREHYGKDGSGLAHVLNTIAYLHKAYGDLDLARAGYEAAAEIWSRSDEHRLEGAAALNNIAQIAVERAELDEAEALFRRVLDVLGGGDDGLNLYAAVRNNLALVLSKKGDLDGAERLHRESLQHSREHVGEDHPQYGASLNNLADLYRDQGRWAEAEPLFEHAVAILQRNLGIGNEQTLKACNGLLEAYEATGQQEAADRLLSRLRSAGQAAPDTGAHILHPVPGLAPLFQVLHADLPQMPDEPEVVGGSIDWTSPLYQRLLAELADDFVQGRYADCARRAIMLNAHEPTHEALQIFLMCLAETPETDAAPQAIQWIIADPWQSALVGVTLGQADPAELEDFADDDEKFCQLLYYAAQRQAADGHIEEALENLRTCASSDVACFETWMARKVLAGPHPASDRGLEARVRELNTEVIALMSRGDFAAAVGPAEEALRLAAGLEENSRQWTVSHYNAASVSYQTGDLDVAESRLLALVAVVRSGGHYDRAAVAGALNVLGMLYTDLARFDRAEPALLDALRELDLDGGANAADRAQVQANLAEVYREMGDAQTAIRICREALEAKRASLGRAHPEYARTMNNLGVLYADIGDLETAEGLLREAQRIRRDALPPQHADLAVSAHCLGHLYLLQDRFDEAEAALQTALDINGSLEGTDTVRYAVGLASLAGAYSGTGRLDEARRFLVHSRAVLNRTVGPVHPQSVVVVANLAVLQAGEGDLCGALELSKEAEDATSTLMFEVFASASERQRLEVLGARHLPLSGYLTLVAAQGTPADEVEKAFDLVQRRKGVVADAQSAMADAMRDGNHPELRSRAEHLRSLREKIARKTLSGPGQEGPRAHRATLAGWTEEKERLEAELARAVPAMRLDQRMRRVSAPLLRSLLPAGSALIEIVRFGLVDFAPPVRGETRSEARYRYWAFVLRPEPADMVRLVDLGDADGIDRLISDYRRAVFAGGSERDLALEEPVAARADELRAGTELRAALLDPLRRALGDARRLILCPDGDLSRLPWEVLPLSPDRRLIDDYEISYLGAGRDLLRSSSAPVREPTTPLVLADPDFDVAGVGSRPPERAGDPAEQAASPLRAGGVRFGRLPGTYREGLAVAALLGVSPVTGGAATKKAVKSCQGRRYCTSPRTATSCPTLNPPRTATSPGWVPPPTRIACPVVCRTPTRTRSCDPDSRWPAPTPGWPAACCRRKPKTGFSQRRTWRAWISRPPTWSPSPHVRPGWAAGTSARECSAYGGRSCRPARGPS